MRFHTIWLLLRGACSHQTFYNICLKLTSRSLCSISNWKPRRKEMRRCMYRGRALIRDATHWLTFPLTLKRAALRYMVINRTLQLASRDGAETAGKKKSPLLAKKVSLYLNLGNILHCLYSLVIWRGFLFTYSMRFCEFINMLEHFF